MGIGEMLYDPQRVRVTWGPIELTGFADGSAITYAPSVQSTTAFDAYLRAVGVSPDEAAHIVAEPAPITGDELRAALASIQTSRESLRAFADMLRDPLRQPEPATPPAELEDDGMVWI